MSHNPDVARRRARLLEIIKAEPDLNYARIAEKMKVRVGTVHADCRALRLPERAPGRPRLVADGVELNVETAEALYLSIGTFKGVGAVFGCSGERIAQLIGRRRDRKRYAHLAEAA